MIWSKTLREAATSARAIVFLWIGLMFVGVLASVASFKAVPRPQACDAAALLQQGSCGLVCNATLPMRNAQPVISVPYVWRDGLFHYSGWFAFLGTWFALMGLAFASGRQSPRKAALQALHSHNMSKRLRQKTAGHTYCGAFCIPPLGIALAFAHIVITELMMMGPHRVPLGEGIDAVGQWGTLVGAFFAIIASFVKVWIDKKKKAPSPKPGRVWPIDLEANTDGASPRPGLGGPRSTAGNNVLWNNYDFGQHFTEGAWWGHKLNGTRIPNEGVIWIVQDGNLHRVDEPSS